MEIARTPLANHPLMEVIPQMTAILMIAVVEVAIMIPILMILGHLRRKGNNPLKCQITNRQKERSKREEARILKLLLIRRPKK